MKVPYVLEFELCGLPKTTNSGGREHWSAKAAEARRWKNAVMLAVPRSQRPGLERARLTLTRVSSVCPDSDGLVSSFKHVIDGLVSAGVLANDKFQNIGMPDYRWEKGLPGAGKIIIRVEEKE